MKSKHITLYGAISAMLLISIQCFFTNTLYAQLTTVPSGGNKKAVSGERIGITDVTIHYDRPGVKGREGKIWGMLIPVGYNDLGFGNTKAAPWRAGSNENTTIEFSTDVLIEGQPLPAGIYGFSIAYDSLESTLIFSKDHRSWGSFYYDPAKDALRVKVKPVPLDKSVEWLKYEFINEKPTSAVVSLQWEKLSIPFTVSVDMNTVQVASFRQELQSSIGFTYTSWAQAAQWCADNNTNLDQALLWADTAVSVNFGGDKSFPAWSTKAQVLEKLGRHDEAAAVMKKALPYGSFLELHQYGRQLIQQKRPSEALEVFQTNYTAHPAEFTTMMGMTRGYSAVGNYKKALEYLAKAEPKAPDPLNKANVEKFKKMLQDGKDVN